MASRKSPRRSGVILLLLLAVVFVVGYFIWNKPRQKAEDTKAEVIEAPALYKAFQTAQPQAQQWQGQVLEVTGTVLESGRNGDGKPTAALQTGDPDGGVVQCTFREDAAIANGQTVRVKGFCNGYTDLAPLGGTVVMNECALLR